MPRNPFAGTSIFRSSILHEFHCLTSLILYMPMCLLAPYFYRVRTEPPDREPEEVKAVCLLFAVSRSTEELKALYK